MSIKEIRRSYIFIIVLLTYFSVRPFAYLAAKNRDSNAGPGAVLIKVKAPQDLPNSKMDVMLGNYVFCAYGEIESEFEDSRETIEIPSINSSFEFSHKTIKRPRYAFFDFTAYKLADGQVTTPRFMVSPGDTVAIEVINGNLTFTGKDAAKYEYMYESGKRKNALEISQTSTIYNALVVFNKIDSLALLDIRFLSSFKDKLIPSDYNLFKMNIIISRQLEKNNFAIFKIRSDKDIISLKKALTNYQSPIWNEQVFNNYNNDIELMHSYQYLNFLRSQFTFDSFLYEGKYFDVNGYYSFIVKNFTSTVREWLIFNLVEKGLHLPGDIYNCIKDAEIKYISNKRIHSYFDKLRNLTVLPGTSAFDFNLKDVNDNFTRLNQSKGKVILIDFFSKGCAPCVALHPYLDSIHRIFKEKNFVFITIFVDFSGKATKADWLNLVGTGKYTSQESINLYGASTQEVKEKYAITALPTILVVDKNGRITKNPINPALDGGRDLIYIINENL